MTASSRRVLLAGVAVLAAVIVGAGAGPLLADEPALRMRASVVGAPAAGSLTIELLRWSTDAERAPLLTALSAPPPPPPAPAEAPAGAAAGRAAGRGARGGGRGAAPASPAARLSAAIAAAPTVGFIWGAGPTGYSIKYAWRSPSASEPERIVLVTDRRLGAHATAWPATPAAPEDQQYTVVEIRLDKKGAGEAKASLTTGVIVDSAARTLALDAYAKTPTLLEVMR